MLELIPTLLFGCMLLPSGCSAPDQDSAPAADAAVGETCSVLAAVPYWAQDEAMASFDKNADQIDYISVFWYNLAPDGALRKYVRANEDAELIARAHQRGVKVLALIANLPDDEQEDDSGTWDPERVDKVIGTPAARSAHIDELLALTRRMGFDGLYIDYEALPASQRQDFTSFIEELSEALHAEDKLLAVALHPKTAEDNPREDNGSAAQDWDALYEYADQLHFMTYSQHTSESSPGPVAALGWVRKIIRYATETRELPPDKLYLGVPLYAEGWYQDADTGRFKGVGRDLMYEDVQRLRHDNNGVEKWSADHASPYIAYSDERQREHIVWFENKRSSAEKLALGNEHGMCALSLWRLGGEDPGFWDLVRKRGAGPGGRGPDPDSPEAEEAGQAGQADDATADDGGQPQPSRPGGLDLKLAGESSAFVELNSAFRTTDPEYEFYNWMVHMASWQTLSLTPRLALDSELRLVLESDGEDDRFYTDFPHEGLWIRRLLLRYTTDHFSVFAGKYSPAGGLRGYAPIFFGNYSVDLGMDRRIGAGASATFKNPAVGEHTLTGHAYHLDTTRMSGEFFTGRDRNGRRDGTIARTGKPDSYMVTLNGGTIGIREWGSTGVEYTLGMGRQKNGDPTAPDEQVVLGALRARIPMGRLGRLTPSLDLMSLRNTDGRVDDNRRSVLLGLWYGKSPLSVGGTYSLRMIEPNAVEEKRNDFITEILARYYFGHGFSMEAAYQYIHERDETENLFGIVLNYWRGWLLD